MSRKTFFGAINTNFHETATNAGYGLIGASVSVGAPIIGTINPALAIVLAAAPLYFECKQTTKIIEESQANNLKGSSYVASAVIKAIINLAIMGATYSIGMTFGPTACFLFLVSFCASKFLNSGNTSPIEHMDNYWSSKEAKYPKNRQSLVSSLNTNFSDTIIDIQYGVVSIATQFPLPFIGELTKTAAALLFVTPFIVRQRGINAMSSDLRDPQRAGFHRAKLGVSTVMHMLVGLGLFATATLLQLDKIAIFAVLIGWAAAKLTSGGENSPLNHIQGFFNSCMGGGESGEQEENAEINHAR